eukprot:6176314-Pleurochrysis_carterae.AAC.1
MECDDDPEDAYDSEAEEAEAKAEAEEVDKELNCKKVKAHWEHMRPHMDGGFDATPANIKAFCLSCMIEKNGREREAGAYQGVERQYTSMYNATVRASLFAPHSKKLRKVHPMHTLARTEWLTDEKIEGNEEFEIDMVKCRRNILCGEGAELRWPVFAVPDDWEPYGGDPTKPGLYEVETFDTTVFHGWGLYYHVTIVYALSVNLIVPSQIRRQLIASNSLPGDHFEKTMRVFDQKITAAYAEMLPTVDGADDAAVLALKQVRKDFLGNLFVGLQNKTTINAHREYLTYDYDYACMKRREAGCVVEKRQGAGGRDCWNVSQVTITDTDGDRRPIYHMVLELERIAMDRLARELRADGATLKYFKTDAIGFSIPSENWDRRKYEERTYKSVDPWHDSNEHPITKKQLCYTVSPIGGLKYRTHLQLCRTRPPYEFFPSTPQWKLPPKPPTNPHTPFTLAANGLNPPPPAPPPPPGPLPFEVGLMDADHSRRLANKVVELRQSVFITGEGGSGKTTWIVKHLIPELLQKHIRYAIATPTCKTQLNMRDYDGCEGTHTLQHLQMRFKHSFAALRKRLGIDLHEPFCFIVDEMSMVNVCQYEMLH